MNLEIRLRWLVLTTVMVNYGIQTPIHKESLRSRNKRLELDLQSEQSRVQVVLADLTSCQEQNTILEGLVAKLRKTLAADEAKYQDLLALLKSEDDKLQADNIQLQDEMQIISTHTAAAQEYTNILQENLEQTQQKLALAVRVL